MQTLLIHHGTSPLGQALAIYFSQLGFQVIVLDCHDEQGYAMVAKTPQIRYWSYHPNHAQAFSQVAQDLTFQFGKLDGLLLLPPQEKHARPLNQAEDTDLLQQLNRYVLKPFQLIQSLRPLLQQTQGNTVLLLPQASYAHEQALIQPCLGALASFSHCFQCDTTPLAVNSISLSAEDFVTPSPSAIANLQAMLQTMLSNQHQLQGQHFTLRREPALMNG
ncbi:hypothetical protein VST7929_01356 [Vibrio stylophorae]|uniref:SDR family oxidoreductase n=1 Tax=Vibrio stylophorae TaxID=659351 RepID=A0ABN8DU26_9VIBR|nr:hypothetical protein [Vibrio stylophorae]CAH0533486.1 hypothetical protein VST7929_01356 [Vibrio stylophorae]